MEEMMCRAMARLKGKASSDEQGELV
jgi:hypothetical protein